jgi:hypothetical protein
MRIFARGIRLKSDLFASYAAKYCGIETRRA